MKKVGKTTRPLKYSDHSRIVRPFKYDLNQTPDDYTVEMATRFKGLDLIECLKKYGQRFIILYRKQ